MTQARGKWVVQLGMPSILRHRRRVTCAQCGASHPAVYKGQRCLICGATIAAASRRNDHVGNVASENQEAQERHRVENAASEAPRADPSAPPAAPDREVVVSASDYERYVRLAARGMAERDNYPMPSTVTTPEMFYEVMADAALHAIEFPVLLGRLERANQQLQINQEVLRPADTNSEDSRLSD
jgi:hypothetical protein